MTLNKSVQLLFLLFILSIQHVYAQNGNHRVNLVNPHVKIGSSKTTFVTNEDLILSFKQQGTDNTALVIQSFNKETLNEISRFECSVIDEKAIIHEYAIVGEKIYIFYSIYSLLDNAESLFALEVNQLTSEVMLPAKKFLSVEGKLEDFNQVLSSDGLMAKSSGKFTFRFTFDYKNMLVSYKQGNVNAVIPSNIKDKVGMHVFNTDLEAEFTSLTSLEHTRNEVRYLNSALDSYGNAFLFYEIEPAVKGGNSKLKLRTFSKENPEGVAIHHSLKDLTKLESIQLLDKGNGDVVIVGLDNDESRVIRMFQLLLDDEAEITSSFQSELPEKTMFSNLSSSQLKEKAKALKKSMEYNSGTALKMEELVLDQEGEIIMILQEDWISGSRGDLVLVKTNQDRKEIVWAYKLPKYQASDYSIPRSYISAIVKDELVLVYSDHRDNFNLSEENSAQGLYKLKNGVFKAAKIDISSGKVNYEHLFNLSDVNGEKVFINWKRQFVNLGANTLAIEVESGKEDKWIRIEM